MKRSATQKMDLGAGNLVTGGAASPDVASLQAQDKKKKRTLLDLSLGAKRDLVQKDWQEFDANRFAAKAGHVTGDEVKAGIKIREAKGQPGVYNVEHLGNKIGTMQKASGPDGMGVKKTGWTTTHDQAGSLNGISKTQASAAEELASQHAHYLNSKVAAANEAATAAGRGDWKQGDYEKNIEQMHQEHEGKFSTLPLRDEQGNNTGHLAGTEADAFKQSSFKQNVGSGERGDRDNITITPSGGSRDTFQMSNTNRGGMYFDSKNVDKVGSAVTAVLEQYKAAALAHQAREGADFEPIFKLYSEKSARFPSYAQDTVKKSEGLSYKTLEGLAYKTDFSKDQRKELASTGAAMSDGSYPIRNGEDLDHAVSLAGMSSHHSKESVKAHIKSRAKDLGLEDKLPETWKADTMQEDPDVDSIQKPMPYSDIMRAKNGYGKLRTPGPYTGPTQFANQNAGDLNAQFQNL
jgi:hypothetical protein